MKLAPSKCYLFVSEACLGGTMVSKKGATPSPDKVAAILQWPTPKSAKDVLSFVNTAAVFRGSIPNFARWAKPLYDLTQNVDSGSCRQRGAYKQALEAKDITGNWGPEQRKSFLKLRTALTEFPVVNGPRYDKSPFYLSTDASIDGLGAHLYQLAMDGTIQTIAYASRGTTERERKYHSSELELLAVKWSLDKLAKYIYGQKIVLSTDCKAVRDMLMNEDLKGARAAWKEAISGARIIELRHTPGSANEVADGLSRNPLPNDKNEETTMNWEQRKGVKNSLYDNMYREEPGDPAIALRRLAVDDDKKLVERFKDDGMEDVARCLTLIDVDKIPEEDRQDALKRAASYFVQGDKLMMRVTKIGPVEVLPNAEGPRAAAEEHGRTHLGRDLCVSALRRRFWWSSMRKDVTEAIERCERCCQFGTRLQKLLLRPIIRFAPFDMIAIDWLFMPPGAGGHNLILVVVDVFTRYIFARSFKGTPTSERTIRVLDEFSSTFVPPKCVLADNQFDTKDINDWIKSKDAAIEFCAPYDHVGLAENANHLVLERLRRLCNLDVHHMPSLTQPTVPRKWVSELARSVSILNERKLGYLGGYSPKELLLGTFPSAKAPNEIDPGLRLLLLQGAREEASDAFVAEQLARKRRSAGHTYLNWSPEINDLVLVYNPINDRTYNTGAKLKVKWQGPYKVVETRRYAVRVETLDGTPREGWIGGHRLKQWKGTRREAERENEVEGNGNG